MSEFSFNLDKENDILVIENIYVSHVTDSIQAWW